MKLKDVEFIVMSNKEFGEHLNQIFEKVGRGEIGEDEPHKIIVNSIKDVDKILTQERIRLLRVVGEKKPESISELARMLNRKESNVYNDVMYLEGMHLLELKEGSNHVKKVPVIEYDTVHVTIPLTASA